MIPILARKRRKLYLLEDRFHDTLAAGTVNGTRSTGGQLRTDVDTNGKFGIAGGVAVFATGAATNDARRYPSMARLAGRTFYAKIIPSDTNGIPKLGWDDNTSGAINDALLFGAAGVLQIVANGGTAFTVGAYTATPYRVWAQMRAAGLFWFIMGGAFTKPTFLFATALGTAAGLPTIGVGNTTSVFAADDALGFPAPLPSPIASDSFVRGDGALGVTDGLGHAEANGGGNVAWVFDAGVWTIATNKAVGTPTVVNSEKVSNGEFTTDTSSWTPANVTLSRVDSSSDPGALSGGADKWALKLLVTSTLTPSANQALTTVAGTWYLYSVLAYVPSANTGVNAARLLFAGAIAAVANIATEDAWSAIRVTTRAAAASTTVFVQPRDIANVAVVNDLAYFDMISAKPLTLSSLFSTIPAGTSNLKVRATLAATTVGTQQGVAVINAANPTQGIIAYQDGSGNVKVDEFTAATTWNALATAVSAFAAGDQIELDLSGNAWRCYKITAAGVATLIGSGTFTANLGAAPQAGMFSTYSGNTFSACTVYAKGNEGQYSVLDALGA